MDRRTARNDTRQSQFVDAYADFQMPLHFDQYNPETWPEEYAKRQLDLGLHPYIQRPPNPNQTYGDLHAPGRAHREESSTSVQHRPVVRSRPPAKANLPKESRTTNKDNGRGEETVLPSYALVPQDVFVGLAGTIIPSIEFTPILNDKPGISIDRACATHRIDNSTDKVFSQLQRIDYILIKILWPGYPRMIYPFDEARISNVRNLSRGELLDRVCKVVVEFVQSLRPNCITVDREHSKWKIGKTGFKVDTFFVARMHHRGGNYFQPEIWVPIPRQW